MKYTFAAYIIQCKIKGLFLPSMSNVILRFKKILGWGKHNNFIPNRYDLWSFQPSILGEVELYFLVGRRWFCNLLCWQIKHDRYFVCYSFAEYIIQYKIKAWFLPNMSHVILRFKNCWLGGSTTMLYQIDTICYHFNPVC